MSDFRFKQFTVSNDRSAMKVNTDGVLLGAAVTIDGACRADNSDGIFFTDRISPVTGDILDIGTGTGTIALMLAQRIFATGGGAMSPSEEGSPRIYAIDIDVPSVDEARANFGRSPWADRLSVEHVPLQGYVPRKKFDLIVSNPPYFDDSLRNPDGRKADARHTASLSFREILEFASRNLTVQGRVAMVLPSEVEKDLMRCARSYGLSPCRLLRIRTTEKKQPRRIIAEFSASAGMQAEPAPETLTIMKEGRYTDEYTALLGDFLVTL